MKITFVEHACFIIETRGKTIVTDPSILDIERAKRLHPQLNNPDVILLSHGHGDHLSSARDLSGADTKVVAVVELAEALENTFSTVALNLGGSVDIDGVTISLTKAEHTSSMKVDGKDINVGAACGFIIDDGDRVLYFTGDTAMFSDMKLINDYYSPDVCILPIGGWYTMDGKMASFVLKTLLTNVKTAIPMHYDTFPAIKADPYAFAKSVGEKRVVVLEKNKSLIV